jgi:hypothetical protein
MSTAPGDALSITEGDLHAHLQARMAQRGVTLEEIQQVLRSGWQATDCRPGTLGKVLVLPGAAEWEGRFYDEKEVTVYYKVKDNRIILLTAKARYGHGFPRREIADEDRI